MEEAFKVPEFLPKAPNAEEIPVPAEAKSEEPEIPYRIPKWNGPKPAETYWFEVLKNGVIVEQIKNLQNKPYWMVGRLPVEAGVNIVAAHPTVSRFHAVIQYKDSKSAQDGDNEVEGGWFIYDLDSTHGTFVNKMRIKPRTYVRLRVGHQLKLGNSTRNYLFQGPSEDEDSESEFTITELREQKAQREAEARQKEIDDKLEKERKDKEKEAAGISWGMDEDAEEEPDLNENPFAVTNNEELFLDDPKRTLRVYFEREGYELEYRCDELSPGVFICRVELPIDDENGKNIICEVQHKGKKKECVVQCALEACRTLDRHGVLRQNHNEPRRSRKAEESDNSDDDIFFDRTGDVEKKRQKKLGTVASEVFTYEQLMEQETEIIDKIKTKEHKLELMVQMEKRQKLQTDEDLDDFMNNLSSMDSKVDKFAISTTKMEIQSLKIEHQKTQKLIKIARPSITLPPITQSKGQLPLFGKRNSLGRNFGVKPTTPVASVKKVDTFEVEEDDDELEESKQMKETAVMQVDDVKRKADEKIVPKDEGNFVKSATKDVVTKTETATSLPKISSEKSKPTSEPALKRSKLENVPSTMPQEPPTTSKEPPATSQEPPTDDAAAKKRKSRVRIRNRLRENIDMNDDDEYIDEEKVSTWVAPENQSGDGTTYLNQKYGY